MSRLPLDIQRLVEDGDFLVSAHADRKLASDRIVLREVLEGLSGALVVEDYPAYPKGPCVLLLQSDLARKPLHILWGLRKNTTRPAVVVTAYRPDPLKWSMDFLLRIK